MNRTEIRETVSYTRTVTIFIPAGVPYRDVIAQAALDNWRDAEINPKITVSAALSRRPARGTARVTNQTGRKIAA